jgi:hypothetical protein
MTNNREIQSNAYDECDAAWSGYRRDHGVSTRKQTRMKEHKAFCAGWLAARYGDTAGGLPMTLNEVPATPEDIHHGAFRLVECADCGAHKAVKPVKPEDTPR